MTDDQGGGEEPASPSDSLPTTLHPTASLALTYRKAPSRISPRNLAMALIYLLHNLIKVSARNELIKSSNPPWILPSSFQHSHCPKHPAPSPALHSGFPLIHVFPRQERLIPYLFPSMTFCKPRCRAAPVQLAEECMEKVALSPFSGHHCFLPGSKKDARFSTVGLQPHHKEKQVGPRKSRLGTSGIRLCQSKAIIGPGFREEKEITYLQKHLTNQ